MAGNLTRINNNQVTDAASGNTIVGINAGTKIQNYSITAGKIANNLTYGSDLTITGNLTVQGTTTNVDTVNTLIQDPLITLADGQVSGTPTLDIGTIGLRGSQQSAVLAWKESAKEFVTALSNTTVSNTTFTISTYANLHTGNTTVQGTTSLVGNLIGAVNATANITGGNLLTPGIVSATATVTGGNLATGGTISGTGNVTGGNILTGGLISATGTITSAANVIGGNLTTAGQVSATANITGGNVLTGGIVSATGTVTGGNLATGGTASVTGNITGGNVLTGGLISATGTITSATTITGGNLATGGTVSATANITGGNVLTGGVVSATANVTGGNLTTAGQVSATGNITGSYYFGNGSQLTGVTASTSGFPITAGTSNIAAATNGNVAVTVGGTSNVFTVTTTGIVTSGTSSVSGNITGGNVLTGGVVSATANVTGGNLTTAGQVSASSNITGGNVLTGGIVSATGTVTGGNLATGGTASATGNITGGNILTGGQVSATGNVTGANLVATRVYSTSAMTITNGSGNINLTPAGNLVLGNTYINNLVLNPVQDQDAASKYYVDNMAAQGLSYHPPVVAATTTTLASTTGGTITYTQPNGVSNGVGAYLTTTGSFNLIDTANVQTANTRILVKNEANAVYNGVYGWANSTTIIRTTDTDEYGPNSVEQLSLNDYFFVTSGNVNAGSAWVVNSPTGVITFGSSNITFAQFSSSQTYTAGNGISIAGTVISAKVDNNTTAFDGSGNIIVKAGANLTTPNIGAATGTSLSVTGTVTAASTVGGVITGTSASVTGNVTGGNLNTGGQVSATATITGGNLITGGQVSATANVTGGNILTGGIVSATGNITSAANVTGGNVTTGGIVSSGGNITGGNIKTGGLIDATGNISGGNIATGGQVTAVGNVTGGNIVSNGTYSGAGNVNIGTNYYFGNGSQLTGVTASTSGFPVQSGTSNINAIASGNIFVSVAGTPNVVVFATSGEYVTGVISANGNVTGGNINTVGAVSTTGNVYAGNVINTGISSVTGNITGGNILTGGLISATATITGGNLATGGTASATGNVTGGNLLTGGLISATSTITSAANVIGGNLTTAGQVSATANITGGNVLTGGIVSATSNITGGNVLTGGIVSATSNITGGNVLTGGLISATGNITGGNVTGGNIVLTGNSINELAAGGTITVNGAGANTNFAVSGTSANVFFVNASTNTASFGNSTQTTNAIVAFNTTSSILIPNGTQAQRPGTGVTGMMRFNSTSNALEIYNNSAWQSVGSTVFTVITDQQFNGDGSTTAFTLSNAATTASTIVSINGITQIPSSAYSVSGVTLTFTEAPATGDLIDVRVLTTTTTVTNITNVSANAAVTVTDTSSTVSVTGSLSIQNDLIVAGNVTVTGNVATNQINNGNSAVQIPSINGNVKIDVSYNDNQTVFTPTDIIANANILPLSNVTYNLGSTTQRFKDLWLSNSTIYLGNAQISANATSIILTNPAGGQTVLAGATTTSSVAGNITGGNILTGGIVSAVGNIITGTNVSQPGAIGIGTATPDAELHILANPQTSTYSITGVSTVLGTDLHIVGADASQTRILQDTFGTGAYVAFTGRAARGTAASASQTQSGDTIVQFTGRGFSNGSLQFGNTSTGRVDIVAAENFTDTSRATNVSVFTTATGAITPTAIATFSSASGLSVAGTVTGSNLVTAGSVTVNSGNGATAIVNGGTNGSGNIGASGATFNTVYAKATTAQYADLAEKYTADAAYAPGTVVVFGGTAEVTVNAEDADRRVAGVVSTDPGFLMNEGLDIEFAVAVALTGRVPCMVIGPVRKGDLMVAARSGRARAEADPRVGSVIGKALEDFDGVEGTIEVVVGRF